jgi:hypothetical protein
MGGRRAIAVLALLAASCDGSSRPAPGPSDAGTSPNASILPAPLAAAPSDLLDAGPPPDAGVEGIAVDERGRLITPDAGPPPPIPLPPDAALPVEAPSSRELSGVTLDAVWRWRDVPPPPKSPEVALEGIKEAQRLTALTWKIDLADNGRMKIVFTSRALPFPAGAELRGRTDRYGAVLLWPNSTDYRVIPPGALRTALGERRVDVTPLAAGTVRAAGEGRRLGAHVRRIDVAASLGTLRLELGKVAEVGEGGELLCRALMEIAGVDPRSPECQIGEVPLQAVYTWQEGGGVTFEVTSITRRNDIASSDMLMPPPGARYAPAGLPIAPGGIFLSREELAAFRSAPLPLPPSADPATPGEGFIAMNQTDMLYYVLIDGVPLVVVPPLSERYVIGTTRGRYSVQWRTFLGEVIEPPQPVEMPARLVRGQAPDAGAPDGG